ncbi:MAG: AMP-binding protein, partial [Actinomycetota bacterium]|nr:AMP-binding protein [Actinomycetota bacterium]
MVNNAQCQLNSYQRDVWAADSILPRSPQFNGAIHERLVGPVDIAALRACVERAIEGNDALGVRFGERDGQPFQWRERESAVVEVLDFRAEPDPAGACVAWMERSFGAAFQALGGRLYQVGLLRESDDVLHVHLRAHHVVMDGWALNEFSRQIFADYNEVMEHGVVVETNPPSYLEFVDDDQNYRASAEYERDREFFTSELADIAPALFVRTVPTGERRFGRTTFTLDGGLIDRVLATGSSPFAFIAATFATYLSRIHRSAEVVLGVPMLNRREKRTLETLGQFANTLPLRVRTDRQHSMTELAAEVRNSTKALRQHERLALGDVLRALPASEAATRQLFDVTLSYVRFPRPAPIAGVERETVIMSRGHDQDALSVVVRAFEDVSEVCVDLEYALDIFDEDFAVSAVGGHIRTLIERSLDQPGSSVDALPMLTDVERADADAVARGPRVEFPTETLHELIAGQIARTPDRTAVIGDETLIDYADLDARADRVARALRAEGVRLGDRVAILLERGPHLVPALLGTLRAGGAYVPVDPGYPEARVRFLLADSGAKVVLSATEVPGVPRERVLRVDNLPDAPEAAVAVGQRDLAYMIYTSGSTGNPKGVMVEHGSVVNRLVWMQRRYPIGPDDVILQKTPISFDVSVWELFWWAIEGATLALLPSGGEKDPREILSTIARTGVTVSHFVPSMLGPFLDLLET